MEMNATICSEDLMSLLSFHLEATDQFTDLAPWIQDPLAFLVERGLDRFSKRVGTVKIALTSYKFLLSNAPADALRASRFALGSVHDDIDKSDLATTFIFLAISNMSLFEEFRDIRYLDDAMDLLELYLTVPNIGDLRRFIASGHLISTLILYHLTIGAHEPLEEALKILQTLLTADPSQTARHILVCSLVLWKRPLLDPEEDQSTVLNLVSRALGLLPSQGHFYHRTIEIIIISVLLDMAESLDSVDLIASLECLLSVLQHQDPESKLRPQLTSSLISAIDNCSGTTTSAAMCILYQADILETKGIDTKPKMHRQVEEDLDRWDTEWEKGCKCFKDVGEDGSLGLLLSTPSTFRLHAQRSAEKVLNSVNILFREDPDLRVHKCMLQMRVQYVNDNDCAPKPDISQDDFMKDLESVCGSLSNEDLDFYIESPAQLSLPHEGKLPQEWLDIKCIKACLLFARYQNSGNSKYVVEAGRLLLTYKPDENPMYVNLSFKVAWSMAGEFGPSKEIEGVISLQSAILRIQERKTAKHFVVMTALCLAMYRHWETAHDTRRLVVALEIFRELIVTRGGTDWISDGRRVIVIGWIMGLRWRLHNDSSEANDQAITILESLLQLASPHTTAIWTSTLETLMISLLNYLARNLRPKVWISALRFLSRFFHLLSYEIRNVPYRGETPGDTYLDEEVLRSIQYDGIRLCDGGMANGVLYLLHMADVLSVLSQSLFTGPHAMAISITSMEESLVSILANHCLSASPAQGSGLDLSNYSGPWAKTVGRLGSCLEQYVIKGSTSSSQDFQLHETYFGYRPTPPTSDHTNQLSFEVMILHGKFPPSPLPAASSTDSPSIASIESWPPLIFEDRAVYMRSGLPSNAMMPWIDDITLDKSHPQFSFPIQSRTQDAFMQYAWWQSHCDARTTSSLYQQFIRVNNESRWIMFDPCQLPLTKQVDSLKSFSQGFASDGPLFILISSGPEKCLEAVDASRTIFWNRLLRLKASFEGVPQPLKQNLEEAAERLGHHIQSSSEDAEGHVSSSKLTPELRQWGDSESEFQHLLSKLREVPGFEDFLQPNTHEQLLKAAKDGPVVVIVGWGSTYAALVVQPEGVESVWLSAVSDEVITSWLNALAHEAHMVRRSMAEDFEREGASDLTDRAVKPFGKRKKVDPASKFHSALAGMWTHIVRPILLHLKLSPVPDIEERPRLWWCPTGPMAQLPIHAAGTGYGTKRIERASDYILSSYIPTPGTLINAHKNSRPSQSLIHSSDLTVLALAQPTTPGQQPLPLTIAELDAIEDIVPRERLVKIEGDRPESSPPEIKLSFSNRNKTVKEALSNLPLASVLHLACHGQQNQAEPLQSGFHLDDGKLTLSKLISCHTPHAFVAFLSTCESASSDVALPDESLSLAAAMLYAGFPSVIGTMWAMNDSDGPHIAKIFYEELFGHPERLLDGKRVSIALQKAIRSLQDEGVHSSRWATYIHVGI